MLVETSKPARSKKQLVIRAFRQQPQLPEGFERGTWETLKAAVVAVQRKTAVGTSLEDLYQAVETMCVHQRASGLYEQLREVCDVNVAAQLGDLASKHLSKDYADFLVHMNRCWQNHCDQMMLIRSIFLYLDRSFVLAVGDGDARGIFDMGLLQFRRHLEAVPELCDKVIGGVLFLLRELRAGNQIDQGILKAMLRMLYNLSMYSSHFEQLFLAATTQTYHAEGQSLSESAPLAAVLGVTEQRLGEESTRCREFMEPETLGPVLAIVKTEMLANQYQALLARGLAELLREERLEDLQRLHRLTVLIGKLDVLQRSFREWTAASGLAIVQDKEKDGEMVQQLLNLRAKAMKILRGPFESALGFANAVREAFEKFINSRENKPAELIAKFLDSKLRGGKERATEFELDAQLDQILAIFRYIQGKDVFEAFYKKDFAKRLLMTRSASIDLERSVIAKLKTECGAHYTAKLEGMLKDEEVSKDIAASFKQSSEYQTLPSGMDVTVRVLTSGFWPTYAPVESHLPEEIGAGQKIFGQYYLRKHNGRRLVWHPALENCTLRARFDRSADKELLVSLHQAMVLLLFNDADSLSVKDIQKATGLPEAELHRLLQSLACGKVRVLRKEPKGQNVGQEDVLTFRRDFTHSLTRIRINQIQVKETEEENKKTNELVHQDRQYQIDAAIVRTMKARKQLSHKLLVDDIMTQLRFNCRAIDVKKRIEGLIEREYLERAPDNQDLYNYLA